MDSSEDEDAGDTADPAAPVDELEAYLALPQVKMKTDLELLAWWEDHEGEFPNVAVMARQYLGCMPRTCPASSAAVERLFSKVGIAFSKKAKSSKANTIAAKMFAHNLE